MEVTQAQIQVRQAVLGDLPALAPLFDTYRQFYGRESDLPSTREFLRARFNHGDSVILLAEDKGHSSVGFVQLYPSFSSIALTRIFILNDLFVADHARRRGAAGALLDAASKYGQRVRATRLTLSTLIDNQAAQALYRQRGWLPDEQFRVFHKVL